MRTTLTIEPDVEALLTRIQNEKGETLKTIVNEALRIGLAGMLKPAARRERFQTGQVDLGRCLIGSLDDVAEALAVAEGEGFR